MRSPEPSPVPDAGTAAPWLLLIHQLPAKPAYLRVKIWRRIQAIGAVAVKNAVYALPAGEQAQEHFQWIAGEIAEGGGDAMICETRLVHGLTDRQVQDLFNQARDADYEGLAGELRAASGGLTAAVLDDPVRRREVQGQVKRLRRGFEQIAAIDFFGANGRDAVEGLLSELEHRARDPEPAVTAGPAAEPERPPPGSVWVTRRDVHVDRIASAWLIRRHIDPLARFKFVAAKGYRPQPGEVRFDMFEAEFTHEGDRCTFEVLLDRFGLAEPAFVAIAEIVHDIDLKDGRYGREETAGLAHLIAGIALAHPDDEERLRRGGELLDDLLAYFQGTRQ